MTTDRFHLQRYRSQWEPNGQVELRESIPSRLDRKQEAIDRIADLMTTKGWVNSEDRPWLVLCLDEAITNAMLHGNEGDPNLAIEIVVAVNDKRWHIGVADQGEGFPLASIPDPDAPETLLLEHGRGIRLMRSWLTSLTYWRGGATVVMGRPRADVKTTRSMACRPADT
ncbi:MAG: ATP-binding protein [Planctomycetota bacterium]